MEVHYSGRWLAYEVLHLPHKLLRILDAELRPHYNPFDLNPKNGKKARRIDNPDEPLKLVQRRIRTRVLVHVPLSDIAHGCVSGRSALTNASIHCGQSHLASVDVKDFYPSVTEQMIYAVYRYEIGFTHRIAAMLTRLTSYIGYLPQGAPTSDALANIVMKPVDREIERIAERLNLKSSRYLDNIDLSGDERAREAIKFVIDALRKHGLQVRHKKVGHAGPGSRRMVTGYLTHGEMPSVPKGGRDRVRAAVHRLIVWHRARPGQRNTELETKARSSLAYLRQTNARAVLKLESQLEDAGILLTKKKHRRRTDWPT